MANLEDASEGGYTAHSPEEFEQWFTGLPPEEQKAYVERITVRSGPTEYITTDRDMIPSLSEAYRQSLIEKYGHIPELNEMVAVDEEPDD